MFEETARVAIEKLDALGNTSEEARVLRADAEELLRIFENWRLTPSVDDDRTRAINRVLDLHRDVEKLAAETKSG